MDILDKTHLFSHALSAEPGRLHFAAHSHHLWPDATRAAHERAWLDAAERADEKWDLLFGEILPRAQRNVAHTLGVDDGSRVVFSANTHDLLVRLFSASPAWGEGRPLRVLSTSAEFHSVTRQMRRLREEGMVEWEVVDAEPFETLGERFRARADGAAWDVVIASHVLFTSAFVFDEALEVLAALPDATIPVLDGYHGYFAVPTDLGAAADRVYYTSGGYKYAMCGEGACFLVAPPGRELRPRVTGWFAGFSDLTAPQDGPVGYDAGAARFFGATFEPTPFYRLNAVFELLEAEGLTVQDLHEHSAALQLRFLERVAAGDAGTLEVEDVIGRQRGDGGRWGNFLTFRRADGAALQERLMGARVVTDVRDDRLRFGFGLYHRAEDVDALAARCAEAIPR